VLTVLAKDDAPLLTSVHNVPSCTLVLVGSTTFWCIAEPNFDACSAEGLITVSFNVLPISCAYSKAQNRFVLPYEKTQALLFVALGLPMRKQQLKMSSIPKLNMYNYNITKYLILILT